MALPTEPGAYLDGGGDVWILTEQKTWYDCNGDRPPTLTDEALAFLEGNGPYTPMPRGVTLTRQYRVRNDSEHLETEAFNLLEEANLWVEKDEDYIEEHIKIDTPWTRVRSEEEETPDEQE